MIYIQLFLSFLQIGAFSFGGGYAAMPLLQQQIVDSRQWLSFYEFTDLITISQMTPGPISINAATFVGIKVAGLPGAVVATLGCILPSCIIVTLIAYFYMKYRHLKLLQDILNFLRPAVVSLIATAGLTIVTSAFYGDGPITSVFAVHIGMVFIFVICLYLLLRKRMNPIFVMILAGVLHIAQYLVGGG